MPLLVTDYSWSQTDTSVFISVPLKGVRAAKVDILSTEDYLKVHFPPYLFEAFLSEPVDDDRSSAKVGNGVALISLMKRSSKVWEHLMTAGEADRKEIRHRALLKHQEKLCSESRSRSSRRHAEKKFALETMMKLENEKRDSVQKMKEGERQKTTAELEAWQLRQTQREEDQVQLRQTQREEDQVQLRQTQREEDQVQLNQAEKLFTCSAGGNATLEQRGDSDVMSRRKPAEAPSPRLPGNIRVTFTPRVFPTAIRESRVPEEEEWLRKQAAARRAVSADVEELEDLKEEQRNPDWLKDRGDKCFAAGDFLGAVNAYSLAIRLNRKIPALYSNRAACHLKLKNLHKAIEDSSQALDLLTPPVAANAAARARAAVRRGSALCQLQLYAEGLLDYQAALQVDPHNKALQEDAQRIRDIIQGSAAKPETH